MFIPLDMDREAGILGGSFTPCFHLPQGLPGPSRLGFPWGMLMLGPGESCPSVPKAPVHLDHYSRNSVKSHRQNAQPFLANLCIDVWSLCIALHSALLTKDFLPFFKGISSEAAHMLLAVSVATFLHEQPSRHGCCMRWRAVQRIPVKKSGTV